MAIPAKFGASVAVEFGPNLAHFKPNLAEGVAIARPGASAGAEPGRNGPNLAHFRAKFGPNYLSLPSPAFQQAPDRDEKKKTGNPAKSAQNMSNFTEFSAKFGRLASSKFAENVQNGRFSSPENRPFWTPFYLNG